MGEGGQIWLKCITGDLIMMIRDKNNIFERVENFHADLAWNYPAGGRPLARGRVGHGGVVLALGIVIDFSPSLSVYSWGHLVVPYTEELISRPFLDENSI